jgi:adenine-specific DNA-methyltransferase
LKEMRSLYKNVSSVMTDFSTGDGTREINELLGSGVFSFPKPVGLISSIVEQATNANDIILDFFAGSGTTGHATLLRNAIDKTSRRYILVQLPEELDDAAQEIAAKFCDKLKKPRRLSEVTKERLRRSAKKVKGEYKKAVGDLGFRVFRLDSTNIQEWDSRSDDVGTSLQASIEHLKGDRSESDILYELLLKLGVELCVSMEKRVIDGKNVYAVATGVLVVCLAEKIDKKGVEKIATGIHEWIKELKPAGSPVVVVRDSAFPDDVAKTNFAAILEQFGIKELRSL